MMRCDRVKMAFHLSALLFLAWSTLSGTAYAQVAPGAGTPGAGAPAGAPTDAAVPDNAATGLAPGVGEIRLDGTVREVNAAASSFVLEVTSFTLTTGTTTELSAPRPRTVVVSAQTSIHPQGATRKLTLTNLKPGVVVTVVGADVGAGKEFPAREIAVSDKTVPSAGGNTGDGAGSTGTAPGSGSSGGSGNLGQTGDLVALKMELAQQIAALRAEMQREIQRLRQTPTGSTPTTGGTPVPTPPANAVTRQQLNDMIAALTREFRDELGRLRADVDQLKAANAPEPPEDVEPEMPEEPPVEEAPDEEMPAEEVPAEEVPAEEAPAEE